MFSPGVKITRMNLKPILPGQVFDRLSPERALKNMRRMIERGIRLKIGQEGKLSPAAKARLGKGFKVLIGESSVTIISTDPAFRPLVEGQKAGQMTWLTKARSPIPIVLDSGEVIFRSATARSMQNGSWYHPGREPTDIIETVKQEVRDKMRAQVKKMLLEQLKSSKRRL